MATIQKTVDIPANMDTVWAKVSDVGNISSLIGFLRDSNVTGNERVCTLEDGGKLVEKIVSVDADRKRVAYTITESPLDLEFHAASMELTRSETGVRLTWTIDMLPDAAAPMMEHMVTAAVADIGTTLT